MAARATVNEPAEDHSRLGAPPFGARIAAGGALALTCATIVVLAVLLAQNLVYFVGAALTGTLGISALWIAATNRRFRWWATVAAVVLVVGTVAILVAAGRGIVAVAVAIFGIAAAWSLGTLALRWEVRRVLDARWHPVPGTRQGVLFMNPRSGGGKVTKLKLADESRRRGIEPVLLQPLDDLRLLAEAAVSRGADALGMAGGDGSQGVVAAVAAEHGLPFVCVPAGTRNHFALDIGIDRDDPVRALDAFGPARETTIDLGEVNGEVFVNNVSLGVYASIVATPGYRQAKRRTVAEMLPDLLGPDAPPTELTVDSPDGPIVGAQVIQVSNNPYTLSSLTGFGSRPRMNEGMLGVAALSIKEPIDVNRLVALEMAGHPERYEGWSQWEAQELEVRGPHPVPAAADGEARSWSAPLHFTIRPAALRVRIGRGQSGASPAFQWTPLKVSTLLGLGRIVRGRPSGMVTVESGRDT